MIFRVLLKPSFLILLSIAVFGCTESDPDPTETSFDSDLLDPDRRSQSQEVVIAPDVENGTVVWLHDQEPINLHPDDPDNAGTLTADWIQQGLLLGLFGLDENLTYYPELLAEAPVPSKQESGDFVVDYRLRDGVKWSDGEVLNAADVKYTFDVIIAGCEKDDDGSISDVSTQGCFYNMGSRRGYSLIKSFEVLGETDFRVTFAAVYPDWKSLFRHVFAQHAFGNDALGVNDALEDFALNGNTLPSSGPMLFDSWERGSNLVLKSNPQYSGPVGPNAKDLGDTPDRFQVRFLPNLASVQQSMLQGKGHFVLTDVSITFDELAERDDIELAAQGGFIWEHIGMNLANDHLEFNVVREAVAAAIDKQQLMKELYTPLFGSALPAEGLGHSFWMPQQPGYINHQAQYATADLALVETNMTSAGYSKNDTGLWEHPEKGIAEFKTATVSNDSFRERQQEIINSQLTAAGFGATSQNLVGSKFYETTSSATGPFGSKESWDLALFAWSGGVWPGGQSAVFGGKSSANNINNIYGYSNTEYDKAAKACDLLVAEADQQTCYAELDIFPSTITGDTGLFIIPLSQKPQFFAYRNDKVDVDKVVAEGHAGPFVNPAGFRLK